MPCELRCKCGKRTMVFQFLTEADGCYTDQCCEEAAAVIEEEVGNVATAEQLPQAEKEGVEDPISKRGRRPKVK